MQFITPQTVESLKKAAPALLGHFVAALFAAWLAWFVTSRTNDLMIEQQQDFALINRFDETGAELDSSMSDFLDSIAENEENPAARKSLRTAISEHAATAQRMANVIGDKSVTSYSDGLGKLRQIVDGTEDVSSAMTAAQLHADILFNKQKISDAAWARIRES
ncbi:hypothetical protein [Sphingorhabdus contaminans]|uniref:hypothetical protein n=1 Tax=Sphingorhabdus contaminans TaxID=1343899 RepID=UPI003D298EAC